MAVNKKLSDGNRTASANVSQGDCKGGMRLHGTHSQAPTNQVVQDDKTETVEILRGRVFLWVRNGS